MPLEVTIAEGDDAKLRAIANAIRLAIVAVSGLADGQVVFASQNAKAPSSDYITVRVDGPIVLGGPRGETHSYDAGQPLGKEIELRSQGPVEYVVKLQAFSAITASVSLAQTRLAAVQAGLQLSEVRATIKAAGASIFDFGKVMDIPRVYGGATEGRAALDLRAYGVQAATIRTGYIERVIADGEGQLAGIHVDVNVTPPEE